MIGQARAGSPVNSSRWSVDKFMLKMLLDLLLEVKERDSDAMNSATHFISSLFCFLCFLLFLFIYFTNKCTQLFADE